MFWTKIPECFIPVAEREWGRGGGRRGQEAPEGGGLKERGAQSYGRREI